MSELKQKGYTHFLPDLPTSLKSLVENQRYDELDKVAGELIAPNGYLYNYIKKKFPSYFEKSLYGFEYIISVRKGPQDIEEDGIWHDDGSRLLAFSLSLNINPDLIKGGELLFRPRNDKNNISSLDTRAFGVLTVFATGQEGWEHKTSLVSKGTRVIMAGWLT